MAYRKTDYINLLKESREKTERDPSDKRAWNSLGVCLKKFGELKDALEAYDKALKIDPNYAIAWYNKGNCLDIMSHFEEALKCYKKAAELDSSIEEIWDSMGLTHKKLGYFQKAIENFDKALEIKPDDIDVWRHKADCYRKLRTEEQDPKYYEKAKECYNKILQIDKRNWDAWYSKALMLRWQKKYDEAIFATSTALSLKPKKQYLRDLKKLKHDIEKDAGYKKQTLLTRLSNLFK